MCQQTVRHRLSVSYLSQLGQDASFQERCSWQGTVPKERGHKSSNTAVSLGGLLRTPVCKDKLMRARTSKPRGSNAVLSKQITQTLMEKNDHQRKDLDKTCIYKHKLAPRRKGKKEIIF